MTSFNGGRPMNEVELWEFNYITESEKLVDECRHEREIKNGAVDQHVSWYDPEVPIDWIFLSYNLSLKGKIVLYYR